MTARIDPNWVWNDVEVARFSTPTTWATITPSTTISDIIFVGWHECYNHPDQYLILVKYGGVSLRRVQSLFTDQPGAYIGFQEELWVLHDPPQGTQALTMGVFTAGDKHNVRGYALPIIGAEGFGARSISQYVMPAGSNPPLHLTLSLTPREESSVIVSYCNFISGTSPASSWSADDTLVDVNQAQGQGISYQPRSGNNTLGWQTDASYGSNWITTQRNFELVEPIPRPLVSLDKMSAKFQVSVGTSLTTLCTHTPVSGSVTDAVIHLWHHYNLHVLQVTYGGVDCTRTIQHLPSGGSFVHDMYTLHDPPQGAQLVQAKVSASPGTVYGNAMSFVNSDGLNPNYGHVEGWFSRSNYHITCAPHASASPNSFIFSRLEAGSLSSWPTNILPETDDILVNAEGVSQGMWSRRVRGSSSDMGWWYDSSGSGNQWLALVVFEMFQDLTALRKKLPFRSVAA